MLTPEEIQTAGANPDFRPFQKIPRWSRDICITEKIDGTNGVVYVTEPIYLEPGAEPSYAVYAGSRNRWLQLGKGGDNFGFLAWVMEHAAELAKLGPGWHHGEWWGPGIQDRYTVTPPDEKVFSLFHPRWRDKDARPKCCSSVPVLYEGPLVFTGISEALDRLRWVGSIAAPGNPAEGIVIYHTASKQLYKMTLENDEQRKGQVAAE